MICIIYQNSTQMALWLARTVEPPLAPTLRIVSQTSSPPSPTVFSAVDQVRHERNLTIFGRNKNILSTVRRGDSGRVGRIGTDVHSLERWNVSFSKGYKRTGKTSGSSRNDTFISIGLGCGTLSLFTPHVPSVRIFKTKMFCMFLFQALPLIPRQSPTWSDITWAFTRSKLGNQRLWRLRRISSAKCATIIETLLLPESSSPDGIISSAVRFALLLLLLWRKQR